MFLSQSNEFASQIDILNFKFVQDRNPEEKPANCQRFIQYPTPKKKKKNEIDDNHHRSSRKHAKNNINKYLFSPRT